MRVRHLSESDYDKFLVLINEFRPTSFTQDQFIERLMRTRNYMDCWVIEDDSDLLGTATILYEDKFIHNLASVAHIEDVCIKECMRGKGLGKMLLAHCVTMAKARGSYKVTLDCCESNVPFYLACGFERCGQQMTVRFDA